MLNQYPWWKYALMALIIIPGLLYALPNLYGEDPGLQIRGVRNYKVTAETLSTVESIVQSSGIKPKSAIREGAGIKMRLANTEDQLKAKDLIKKSLGDHFTVALSLMPATPHWMAKINALPMYLGLDLRGGVHFLLDVDLASAISRAENRYVGDLRSTLREAAIRYRSIRQMKQGGIELRLRTAEDRTKAAAVINKKLAELTLQEVDREGNAYLLASLTDKAKRDITQFAVEQNMTALRNRIDELGVAEPVVQRQGEHRIVVQLPGVQDTAKAKEILGRTATLEIRMVDEEHDLAGAINGTIPAGSAIYYYRDKRPILLRKRIIYSGDNVVDAAAGLDSQRGGAVVFITLDARGATINQRITGKNIGKRMAVVYKEIRSEAKLKADGTPVLDKKGKAVRIKKNIEEVITAPVIRDQLGRRFQIEGIGGIGEARDLSLLLRAGALAAPIDIVEERTVGPSLGQENINQGFRAVVIGFIVVLIFMLVYYRLFGLVANVALALNLVLTVAVLSLFQATLTLPGVAGIVLTVGMAVDANVLIYERIREELRNGNSPHASIHAGYDRAFTTIVDANVTTLIAAIVLFNFGTGPIKGFAVTLSVGIITSMFTAIFVTRGIINLIYGGRTLKRLAI